MKDSQPTVVIAAALPKYIKANNERFSTLTKFKKPYM